VGEQAELVNSGQLTVKGIVSHGLVTGSGSISIAAGGSGSLSVHGVAIQSALARRAASQRATPVKLTFQRIRNMGVISADLDSSTRLQFDSLENSGTAAISSSGEVSFSTLRNLKGGRVKIKAASGAEGGTNRLASARSVDEVPPITLGAVVNEPGGELILQGSGSSEPEFLAQVLQNQGEMALDNASAIVTSGVLNGAGGEFSLLGSTSIAPAAGQDPKFENAGTVIKSDAGDATVELDWVNKGQVTLEAGTLCLTSETDPLQLSGRLTLDGGDLQVLSGKTRRTLVLQGGILDGSGSIEGNVLNAGASINIGHSPGTTTINGNYTQTTNGTLNMEIGGTQAGTGYDQLIVYGTANLAGTMNALKYGAFVPNVGASFMIIQYTNVVGDFNWTNLTTSVATYSTRKTLDYYAIKCVSRTSSLVGVRPTSLNGPSNGLDFRYPVLPRNAATWKPAAN
jgi:hypothetical protein